jgi:hypothetical protein
MFLWIPKVYFDSKFVEHIIHKGSKLLVALDFYYMESGFVVNLKNIPEGFSVDDHCFLINELSSMVKYVFGDGCQNSESIDLDAINAEGNLVVLAL